MFVNIHGVRRTALSVIHRVLYPKKMIRRMAGGSQSILIECSDGTLAIVKMFGNPQGPNVLANEYVGSILGLGVGLPLAQFGIIHLSDLFIDGHPELWFEDSTGKTRPSAGLHFASLFTGQTYGGGRPAAHIPRSRVETIRNRSIFWAMYIFDLCTNHKDSRQALMLTNAESASSEIVFIDNGHLFGGPDWSGEARPGEACHLERSIYDIPLCHRERQIWVAHFQANIPPLFDSAASTLPSEWYHGDIKQLRRKLLIRLANLEELFQEDGAQIALSSPQKSYGYDIPIPHPALCPI